MSNFAEHYGPWAVVAGASEGLGLAFAEELAARKLKLILLARREDVLERTAKKIREAHGTEVRTLACDLADASFGQSLHKATHSLEVGLGIYNAAYSFVGETFETPLANALRVVDVNCRGPLIFAHTLVPGMVERHRGGLVLMSSVAGFLGSPRLAPYAASKAFNRILAEGLWAELHPKGVDVVVSCPGATRTPNYAKQSEREAPGTLDAREVAVSTLNALGHGPTVVPGAVNKLASFFLGHLLPRKNGIRIMAQSTADLRNSR